MPQCSLERLGERCVSRHVATRQSRSAFGLTLSMRTCAVVACHLLSRGPRAGAGGARRSTSNRMWANICGEPVTSANLELSSSVSVWYCAGFRTPEMMWPATRSRRANARSNGRGYDAASSHQCRPPPALRPSRTWAAHADAGHAQMAKPWSLTQRAQKGDQDRREGQQPRPPRDVPDRRGPRAAADLCMSGAGVGSDQAIDGSGASRCRHSAAYQRLGEVNSLSWTFVVHRSNLFTIAQDARSSDPGPQSALNWGNAGSDSSDRQRF